VALAFNTRDVTEADALTVGAAAVTGESALLVIAVTTEAKFAPVLSTTGAGTPFGTPCTAVALVADVPAAVTVSLLGTGCPQAAGHQSNNPTIEYRTKLVIGFFSSLVKRWQAWR
jgi:hypothetical protein